VSATAPLPDGAPRVTPTWRARVLAGRVATLVVFLWLLAGCAIPFGKSSDGDSTESLTPKESNSLYLREQEQEIRRRQGPVYDFGIPNR